MKWKLGDLAGIGVYVHWSFWLLPAWIVFSMLLSGGGMTAALSAVILLFVVFGCVVLHELGHALAARQFGVGTRDITLYPMGGLAQLERMPRSPFQELVIAVAGPAVNLTIAGAIFVGTALLDAGYQGVPGMAGGTLVSQLMVVNIALAVFNLLPAFPMDGGRVLRAFLAMRLPYARATTIAARVGQGIAALLAVVGLFSNGMLLLVALFVFLAAQAELVMVRAQDTIWHPVPPPISPFAASWNSDGIVWLDDKTAQPQGVTIVRVITRPGYRYW